MEGGVDEFQKVLKILCWNFMIVGRKVLPSELMAGRESFTNFNAYNIAICGLSFWDLIGIFHIQFEIVTKLVYAIEYMHPSHKECQ